MNLFKRTLACYERVRKNPLIWLVPLVSLALIVRLYRLGEPVLRWDEGWSLAHASLPWRDLMAIGAQEWHPPLYIALLKLWLVLGKSARLIRLFSVLTGVTAVPLAYLVGRDWSGSLRAGLLMAGFAALFPLLVYYGQVARMYALSALMVLLTAWFLLCELRRPSRGALAGLVLAAAFSLYTFYLSAWALLGMWLFGMLTQPRRAWRLLLAGIALAALYVPWLVLARGTLAGRFGGISLVSTSALAETVANLRPALEGLAFTYSTRRGTGIILILLLAAGLVAGFWRRARYRELLLPACVLIIGVFGSAYSARFYWVAARHLVPLAPFLGLALTWSLDRLYSVWKPLLLVALVALGVFYWPSCSAFVYEKTLEVTGPFDPAADYRYLVSRAGASDLVFFNVLARAGWYENLRTADDAGWSYALSWEPIVEPVDTAAARVTALAAPQQRLWFAFYQGDYGSNSPLVTWLSRELYPAGAEWQDEMLYLAYARPGERWTEWHKGALFGGALSLHAARWSASLRADQALTMELEWSLSQELQNDYKVFVHLVTADGRLIAQHDGVPSSGDRPFHTWAAGELVMDRHALFLPRGGLPAGTQLRLLAGVYDAQTAERLLLADGADFVELGTVIIE